MLARIPAPAFLWVSILVFAASSSIVRILSDLGAMNPIDGRNAISFCNLLFAGNVCALVVMSAIHHRHWTLETLRRLTRSDWINLLVLSLLTSCIAPWLFFVAIENTMVTSVVLVSQIETPLLLALSWLVFKDRIGPWAILGAGLSLFGVALTVLLQPPSDGLMIGKGELSAAGAAVVYALSTIIAKPLLKHIPTGIFSVVRTGVGTVVFFAVAAYLYGPEHFQDVASPFLWQWMVVYGGIIIVGGQLAWITGLRSARAIDISLATSATPIAGVLAAYLILGEQPMTAHYVGGAVLMIGIGIGVFGSRRTAAPASVETKESAPSTLATECRVGFRGV
jgi:drug/metabolite transporter (DMT)-like permease